MNNQSDQFDELLLKLRIFSYKEIYLFPSKNEHYGNSGSWQLVWKDL